MAIYLWCCRAPRHVASTATLLSAFPLLAAGIRRWDVTYLRCTVHITDSLIVLFHMPASALCLGSLPLTKDMQQAFALSAQEPSTLM